ncbi:MAG: alkaline phosphatase PhoX, partial [Bacteroidota bacterium]
MYNRRKFISFLGKAGISAVAIPPFLTSCGNTSTPSETFKGVDATSLQQLGNMVLEGLTASDQDDLLLTKGLDYHTIIKWGDAITDNDTFGFNNDFTCFIPFDQDDPKDGLLWVNHEYVSPLFVSGFDHRQYDNPKEHRTIEQVDKEMYAVERGIVRIKEENGKWRLVKNDPHTRRLTAHTPISLNWDSPIKGKTTVMGTNSNCSGGITPWNTFLTCEENYHDCFGETVYD